MRRKKWRSIILIYFWWWWGKDELFNVLSRIFTGTRELRTTPWTTKSIINYILLEFRFDSKGRKYRIPLAEAWSETVRVSVADTRRFIEANISWLLPRILVFVSSKTVHFWLFEPSTFIQEPSIHFYSTRPSSVAPSDCSPFALSTVRFKQDSRGLSTLSRKDRLLSHLRTVQNWLNQTFIIGR